MTGNWSNQDKHWQDYVDEMAEWNAEMERKDAALLVFYRSLAIGLAVAVVLTLTLLWVIK